MTQLDKPSATARAPRWQWVTSLLLLALYTFSLLFLHQRQLYAAVAGDGLYDSDLVMHMAESITGNGAYSLISLLFHPAYLLGGYWMASALIVAFHLGAVAAFALCMHQVFPHISTPLCLSFSVLCNLACAVYTPRGGFWFLGTIFNPIYHNITYTAMLPFALLSLLYFVKLWPQRQGPLPRRTWLMLCAMITLSTLMKTNFVIAFAPALLLFLIADLFATRGKNLLNEVLIGCTVLPSIVVALVQMSLLTHEKNPAQMTLIFLVDYDPAKMPTGPYNEPGILGLIRSFVFVAAVALLFCKTAWGRLGYRFSLLCLCVTLAQALLFVETEPRLYHGNFWWGSYVCFFLFFMESGFVWLQELKAWRGGARDKLRGLRLLLCGALLAWHIISGICFLVMLLQGQSYNIPIKTWKIWPFSYI